MCLESCVGFTGPFTNLKTCPFSSCGASHWDPGHLRASNGHVKVTAKKFTTIPLGPQLQAQYGDPQSAHAIHYLYECTQEIITHLWETGEIPVIDNIAMGLGYLGPVLDGDIKENDIVLMVSLNGMQLYEHKDSDCWMYVWIIVNLAPNQHYQKIHVCPGGFIPGPNKPKNLDLFLYVGMLSYTVSQPVNSTPPEPTPHQIHPPPIPKSTFPLFRLITFLLFRLSLLPLIPIPCSSSFTLDRCLTYLMIPPSD
ncbi:hypothetical protein PAXRUDRAFT_174743 [Paxillus rubicundulus Ve08.2h10]|uniref:Uncharacterized protein n=1 Tax=Paxillus rubicundulus Ve08.2h10 TaxID=930991 RepID=A0A0D0CUG3_9AGAM|nr:hypothetical protein PAXRUDRAFT_174743 [Paxillus rubicundulus Ve08.2h10]